MFYFILALTVLVADYISAEASRLSLSVLGPTQCFLLTERPGVIRESHQSSPGVVLE